MHRSILTFVFMGMVIGGIANGAEPAEKKEVTAATPAVIQPHVLARMEEDSGEGRLFLYSEWRLRDVFAKVESEKTWTQLSGFAKSGKHIPYGTAKPFSIKEGDVIELRGTLPNAAQFADTITVGKSEEGNLTLTVKGGRVAFVELSTQELLHGSRYISAQRIAQARVNYMVRTGAGAHIGSGCLPTAQGFLCEGWGMGGSRYCHTCVGNGRAVADAACKCRGGYQRIRLYHGGTH